jgi:MinD superfamily P-loop ATPase
MPELVVISGKGGTGKTSVVASLAALAWPIVMADCDVDASDLHLVLEPSIRESHAFVGGSKARIDSERCMACGKCEELCRFDAIICDASEGGQAPGAYRVDTLACEGCGVCARFCPEKAIELLPAQSGQWFVSETRFGPMVHARLDPAAGNSGKLINQLRQRAKQLVTSDEDVILCDGSPGIGCPVIASLTGADLALIVAEPTLSSLHDLERVWDLCRHFHMKAAVAVNKWDINPTLTEQIESQVAKWGLPVAGRLRYDPSVSAAQVQRKSVVEHDPQSGVTSDLQRLWQGLLARLSRG